MKHILTILLIFVAVVDAENVFADRSFATPAEVIADVVAERTDNNLIVKMRIMPSAASLPSNRSLASSARYEWRGLALAWFGDYSGTHTLLSATETRSEEPRLYDVALRKRG